MWYSVLRYSLGEWLYETTHLVGWEDGSGWKGPGYSGAASPENGMAPRPAMGFGSLASLAELNTTVLLSGDTPVAGRQ